MSSPMPSRVLLTSPFCSRARAQWPLQPASEGRKHWKRFSTSARITDETSSRGVGITFPSLDLRTIGVRRPSLSTRSALRNLNRHHTRLAFFENNSARINRVVRGPIYLKTSFLRLLKLFTTKKGSTSLSKNNLELKATLVSLQKF